MIRVIKPLGTILFGRAMVSQLNHELSLLNVKHPVVLTEPGHERKGRQLIRQLTSGYFDAIPLTTSSIPSDCDCLLLAGGKSLSDQFRDDDRIKVLIPLCPDHLSGIREPETHMLVIDKVFIGKKQVPRNFFDRLIRTSSSGLVTTSPSSDVPDSFTFHNRTIVFSGHKGLAKVPELMDREDINKPLILTDQGIIAARLLDRLKDILDQREYRLFSEIPPDSRIEVVNRISHYFQEEECDGIIALGGGSVLDTAKGAALNVSLHKEDLNSLVGSGHIPFLEIPLIALPTTSGTGSEVTKVAVISDPEKGRKLLFNSDNLQPAYAVLDSSLTMSLPPFLTSITGMDALTHAVEAYTCMGKNPLSDHLAWTAISLIRDHLIAAVDNPSAEEHRRALALASNFAGLAFSNSMVGMVHTVGHSIGAVCHAPHGSCMSVLLPHVLEYNMYAIEPLLAQLLEALAGQDVFENTREEERSAAAIREIRSMNNLLREKTDGRHPVSLSHMVNREGVSLVGREQFPLIAETALGDASIIYNPVELRIADVLDLLEKAY